MSVSCNSLLYSVFSKRNPLALQLFHINVQ